MGHDKRNTSTNGESPLSEAERKAQWEAFEKAKRMLFSKGKEGSPGVEPKAKD
jgi:hypothetical protein